MELVQRIADSVAGVLDSTTSDRYTQIFAIKAELKAQDLELYATDRETIDAVLDILFDEYAFNYVDNS
tara:strand:+ start:10457 stop:10660 length:204 start_codon:yes stop_codon:yes gene_type:complete